MASDRSMEERVDELERVLTRIFTYFDSMRLSKIFSDEAFDNGEAPEFGPWMDTDTCYAQVISIRTDFNGNFQFATLKLLHDNDPAKRPRWKKGKIMDLRNPKWEPELKRAQSNQLMVGLRLIDERVIGIEVMPPDKRLFKDNESEPSS